MALSPITPFPVQSEHTLVDLQPASQYGHKHDIAMINTTLLLQAPAAEEVVFALPSLDAPEQAPLLRVVAKTAGVATEFEETTFEDVDRELRRDFRQARRDDWDYFYKVLTEEAHAVSWARVRVEQGDQLVRFHYPYRVPQVEPGVYEFRVLAPLASFLLNPSQGEISFAVALPRIQGRNIQLVSAHSENPPDSPGVQLTEQASLGQRLFLGHFVRLDPLYSIRYRYA